MCGFEPARHHLFLLDQLMNAAHRKVRKLMICMPPGSAKSTYSSVLFPPFFLSLFPQSNILACSHSTDLATTFGRNSRNLLVDHEKDLGIKLRQDTQAADEWAITTGGLFFCAGVGSKIAGRRADLALIDDPVGSREDAYSKIIRDKTWAWYRTDFQTRLKPNAVIVLIQTRWHEDDLAGRLLATEGSEWTVINLPMIAKENDPLGREVGELLWNDYFTPGMVAEAKKDPMTWSSLYQQDPTPEDGDYFKRADIEASSYGPGELPDLKTLTYYAASDHAVSQKQTADSNCIVSVGVDPEGIIWVLPDVFWQRCDSKEMVERMLNLMAKRSYRTWFAEADSIGKSIGPFLRAEMRSRGINCYIEEMRPSKDKQTRGQSIRARIQARTVRFPRHATWYGEAITQMLKFPAGAHDDFVDPLAYIGLGLDRLMVGRSRPKVVDESLFWLPRKMTMKWIKENDRQENRLRELALADN